MQPGNISADSISDDPANYRVGAYDMPIHKDLDALAVEITKAAVANKGVYSDPYFIEAGKWHKLMKYQEEANGGTSIAKGDCNYINFILRGVAVCPAPTKDEVNAAIWDMTVNSTPETMLELSERL